AELLAPAPGSPRRALFAPWGGGIPAGASILKKDTSAQARVSACATQISSLLPRCSLRARRSVLHVFVEPAKHLVNKLLVRLHGGIPVRLVGEQHQARRTAIAANCFVKLDRF